MNRSTLRNLGLVPALLLGGLLAVASAQSAKITVTPVAVRESRNNVLIPTKQKSFYFDNS